MFCKETSLVYQNVLSNIATVTSADETVEREFSVRERIPDNHPKVVLSLDEYQRINRGGIRQENLRVWLVKEDDVA